MAQFTRTWWGKRFIEALESFTDPGRLGRGRSYARSDRIQSYTLNNGKVTAKVRGNINPYFGVYKVPIYNTSVQITPIPEAQWGKIVERCASKASTVSKLLMNEMPDNVEDAFTELGLHLLPHSPRDFITRCSCPDFSNPCKHVAGICYLLAAKLDQDPFLLFELRGLARDELRRKLEKTPLGKALASALQAEELPLRPLESYYTRPQRVQSEGVGYRHFWQGEKRLPVTLEPLPPPGLPAVLIRKAGDYPPFWQQDQSFIETISELYERIRKQNKEVF